MDSITRRQLLLFFKDWILSQEKLFNKEFMTKQLHDELAIETDYCQGVINIYPEEIIEMRVINKLNEEPLFYLHFQMSDITVAQHMYIDMIDVLNNGVQPKTKILLCCSNGFTTNYFASKLNAAAELLENDFEFAAVPFVRVNEVNRKYDKILLAPQLGHKLKESRELWGDKVFVIPAKIFGAYKVKPVFDWLNRES